MTFDKFKLIQNVNRIANVIIQENPTLKPRYLAVHIAANELFTVLLHFR